MELVLGQRDRDDGVGVARGLHLYFFKLMQLGFVVVHALVLVLFDELVIVLTDVLVLVLVQLSTYLCNVVTFMTGAMEHKYAE